MESALKYAPSGSSITLEATVSPDAVRGSTAEGCRGSGLGLSVVQLLMERMGGSVALGEGPEGGADFQLALPVRSRSNPPSA